MIGHHIFPEATRERYPGQVPRLHGKARRTAMHVQSPQPTFDPAIDPARPAPPATLERYWAEHRPVLRPQQVAVDLGLGFQREKAIGRMVKNAATGAQNELDFRRGLMSSLLMDQLDPTRRRHVMRRALDFYRRALKKSEGELEEEEHLVVAIDIEDEGHPDRKYDESAPTTHAGHVMAEPVAKALLYVIEPEVARVLAKSLGKGKVGQGAPAGAGGVGGGSVGSPVGTRKTWNNRIVEKKPDGKWHVVGHVAGLEGEKVPSKRKKHGKLDVDSLSREEAAHLIAQLKREKKQKGGSEKPAEK